MVEEKNFEINKKSLDKVIIYGMIIILIVLFALGLSKTYEKGLYDGAKKVCNDLDIGIDNFGDYVCYNKTLYDEQQNLNFLLDIGGNP